MAWVGRRIRRRKRYDDLAVSIEEHIAERVDELMAAGMQRADAQVAARRAFGNVALIAERSREVWQWRFIEQRWADVRFAVRQMAHSPRFTIAAVATLAIGIGAQATIYSVVRAVLIDPFPYRGSARIVHLHLYGKDPAPNDLMLDGPQFAEFTESPVLDGAVADDSYTMSLTGNDLPEQLEVGRISPDGFEFFGVPPLLGREFSPSDVARAAVLSYRFWNSHFAARTDVIGGSLELNREKYTIVGVMPQRFAWMGSDVYVPLAYSTDPGRAASVYARLRPGVSDREAEQALEPLLDAFARDTPANFPAQFKLHLVHIDEIATGRFRGVLVALFVAVSFLLVLACVNVAILLLARGETRQVEIAMRKALGAGRVRIVGQLLTESILLAAAGGFFGVLFAMGGLRLVRHMMQPLPTLFPPEAVIALNLDVLWLSVGVAMATGVFFGLWPAVRLAKTELVRAVDSGAQKLASRRGAGGAHMLLLTIQVAITVVLLACSGATLRKLSQLIHANLGYEPQNVASVNLVSREGSHDHWADRVHYHELIREAIAADPNVISAAIGNLPPGVFEVTPLSVPGMNPANAVALQVSPEYFSTLRIPVLAGRVWTSAEAANGVRFALINEAMRRRWWPNSNPIGQTLVLNNGTVHASAWKLVAPGDDQHFQIIGVVGDSPNRGLDEQVSPGVYVPYSMTPYDGFNVVFRARGDPATLLHAIKEHVRGVDGSQAVGDLATATDVLEGDSLGRERFVARLFSTFGLLGLAFAVSGLYSILSYLVAQRTRELGVRMALGARRAHIVDCVTRASSEAVLMGTAAGIALSLGLSQVLAHWTAGNARDPGMLAAVAGVLLVAAVLASVGPALAAASIAPTEALRAE
jgi:predicted permease